MKRHHTMALAVSAGIVCASAALATSAIAAPFDGKWNVRLVTHSGTCDSSYNQTIAIENGQVRALASGEGPAISGGIESDGTVALTIRRSIAQANASGRLTTKSGVGAWTLAMLGCSGRWTATRA
jgi:hypothetical protein